MFKIWGRRTSSNVQKVLWAADELGLAYEQVDLGGPFGGTDSAAYRKLNPNGLVPTIEDGDFVLWESNAIMRYLVDKYGAPDGDDRLLADTPEGRAEADRWMCWDQSTMAHAVWRVYFAMIRQPEAERDLAKLERNIAGAAETLSILDRHLADGRAFVTGEAFSLGDIPAGIWTHRWLAMAIQRPKLAALEAWYERLGERPAYRQHVLEPALA